MSQSIKKFFIFFVLCLFVWFSLYELVLRPSIIYDAFIIEGIAEQCGLLLELFGYNVLVDDRLYTGYLNYVSLVGSQGVVIGPGCDGLVVMALFSFFILCMPGSVKHKLWFIPLGVVALHLLNVIRASVLTVIMAKSPEWLAFNHDYTFTALIYGFVFFLWVSWTKRFANSSSAIEK